MSPFTANFVTLSLLLVLTSLLACAMLARVGSWQISRAASLNLDEGLPVGAEAPQVAATSSSVSYHLEFLEGFTLLVFGSTRCAPCLELVRAASFHPATRNVRLVFIGDSDPSDFPPEYLGKWEIYKFHDEGAARKMWKAPVSPYFHFIDPLGRVVAKGTGNRSAHLDRLLTIAPPNIAPVTLNLIRQNGERQR